MQKRNKYWFRLKHRTNNFNNPKVTKEQFVEWKRKILQEVDSESISLKYQIKVHKTNLVLKQDAAIGFLNELHETYVFVPTDKAAKSNAIICKKYYSISVLF